MANQVWKGFYFYVFGRSCQLLINKLFDASPPSMRKVDNVKKKKKYQPSGARGTHSLPTTSHCLQNPKMATRERFLGVPINFR